MDLSDHIQKLAEEFLAPGQFIVSAEVSARKGPKKVLILADADQGFSIDDCAELSRQVSKALDDRGLIEDNYLLEVSTPGVDHPLKLKRQYTKNVGRSLKLKLQDKTIEGKLTEVKDQSILLAEQVKNGKKTESKIHEIPFDAIEKALVMVSFK
ncbi:MAG TPA: ribosome maturation factor RimP [Chryseosolibacter sp.]|nr:ribosome maturation factor RimP [Chryseosolibacter sp.]